MPPLRPTMRPGSGSQAPATRRSAGASGSQQLRRVRGGTASSSSPGTASCLLQTASGRYQQEQVIPRGLAQLLQSCRLLLKQQCMSRYCWSQTPAHVPLQ